MDDFVVIFITLPPIAIHETTQEQVVPHLPGIRVRNKALQLASSTQTSYLCLVLMKHLGLRGAQKPIHDAFGHRADHGRLRGRAKRYFRTKQKFGMTFPKNRTKKNAWCQNSRRNGNESTFRQNIGNYRISNTGTPPNTNTYATPQTYATPRTYIDLARP